MLNKEKAAKARAEEFYAAPPNKVRRMTVFKQLSQFVFLNHNFDQVSFKVKMPRLSYEAKLYCYYVLQVIATMIYQTPTTN